MTGARSIKRPLTDEERALVERYHNIIYRVMSDFTLPKDPGCDIYGECALALIRAAQKYLSKPELQKYSFNTIAYKDIKSAITNNVRSSTGRGDMYSLDYELEDGGTLGSIIAYDDRRAGETSPQTMRVIRKIRKKITAKQMTALSLYANGLTYAEASRVTGINEKTIATCVLNAKRKLLPMADELFGTKKSARQAGT